MAATETTIDDGGPERCEVEWERPKSVFCNPHQYDLPSGHKGDHVCDCGWHRRNMSNKWLLLMVYGRPTQRN